MNLLSHKVFKHPDVREAISKIFYFNYFTNSLLLHQRVGCVLQDWSQGVDPPVS